MKTDNYNALIEFLALSRADAMDKLQDVKSLDDKKRVLAKIKSYENTSTILKLEYYAYQDFLNDGTIDVSI